jgi:hypothetical protein
MRGVRGGWKSKRRPGNVPEAARRKQFDETSEAGLARFCRQNG